METLPSLEALAAMFGCELRRGDEHPEYGLFEYEVEFDSEHERVSLKVLPLAEEVSVNVFTRNLELTPFHGHLIVQQKGVQDAQTAYP